MDKNRILYQSDDILYSWFELPVTNKDCAVIVLDPTFKDIIIVDVSGLDETGTDDLIKNVLPKELELSYNVDRKIGNTYFASYASNK